MAAYESFDSESTECTVIEPGRIQQSLHQQQQQMEAAQRTRIEEVGDDEEDDEEESTVAYMPPNYLPTHAVVNVLNTEMESLLRLAIDSRPNDPRTVDLLRTVRKLVKKSGGQLPLTMDKRELFTSFGIMLSDRRPKIVTEVTMLMVDSIPGMNLELDHCMTLVLPKIVPNLGHESTDVRRATLRLLHVYMRYTNNLQRVLRYLVDYGLESIDGNSAAQKGTVLSLPLLFTDEFSNENLFPLVASLSHLLVAGEASLFYPSFLALQRLHSLVGNQVFKRYLQRLPPEAVALYHQVRSRNSSEEGSHHVLLKPTTQIVPDFEASELSPINRARRFDVEQRIVQDDDETEEGDINEYDDESGEDGGGIDHTHLGMTSTTSRNLTTTSNGANGKGAPTTKKKTKMKTVEPTSTVSPSHQHPQPTPLRKSKTVEFSIRPSKSSVDTNHHRIPQQSTSDYNLAAGDQSTTETSSSEMSMPTLYHPPTLHHHENRPVPSYNDPSTMAFQLEYGIFPYGMVMKAMSNKLPDKIEGVNQMLTILRECPAHHANHLVYYLEEFLSVFALRLLEHQNFKINMLGLDMLEVLVERLPKACMKEMDLVINLLLKRLGDSRAVVRQHNIRVLHRFMFHFPPQLVLDSLFVHKHHRNPRVREEMINRITAAVLMFPRTEFNLAKLCYAVAPMLTDGRRQVRLAALECLAVLAQALGPHRMGPLLTAVEAIQANCDSDGLINAVHARLARRALPRCNPDGSLRYVLNPASFSGWVGSNDADLEWVMMAPAAHGTPPKSVSDPSMTAPKSVSKMRTEYQPPVSTYHAPRREQIIMGASGADTESSESISEIASHVVHERDLLGGHHHVTMQHHPPETNMPHIPSRPPMEGDMMSTSSEGSAIPPGGPPLPPGAGAADGRRDSESSVSSSTRAELWRHYLQKFKQSLADACGGSFLSGVRYEYETYDRERQGTFIQVTDRDIRDSESETSSSAPPTPSRSMHPEGEFQRYTDNYQTYPKKNDQNKLQPSKIPRLRQRAYSMPPVNHRPMSNISEKSTNSRMSSGDTNRSRRRSPTKSPAPASGRRTSVVPDANDLNNGTTSKKDEKCEGADGGGGKGEDGGEKQQDGVVGQEEEVTGETTGERKGSACEGEPPESKVSTTDTSENPSVTPSQTHDTSEGHPCDQHQEQGTPNQSENKMEDENNGDKQDKCKSHMAEDGERDSPVKSRAPSIVMSQASDDETGEKKCHEDVIFPPQQAKIEEDQEENQESDKSGRESQQDGEQVGDQSRDNLESTSPRDKDPSPGSRRSSMCIRFEEQPDNKQESPPPKSMESRPGTMERMNEEAEAKLAKMKEEFLSNATESSETRYEEHPEQLNDAPPSRRGMPPAINLTEETESSEGSGETTGLVDLAPIIPPVMSRSLSPPCTRSYLYSPAHSPARSPARSPTRTPARTPSRSPTRTPATYQPSRSPAAQKPAPSKKTKPPPGRRISRSISPPRRTTTVPKVIRMPPAIPANANIRHILENVAETEGPFEQPDEALKAAVAALHTETWSTKVEGMLAVTRLASFHASVLAKDLHTVVQLLAIEVRNLRSTVARSAIFTLGDLFKKMRKQIESELDLITQALLQKAGENMSFMRDDLERALLNMVEEMPQSRAAIALIAHGANHRNLYIRKTAAQFLALLVEKMGATKAMFGPRDISSQLMPACARFVMDGSPHTRYYGRKIFSILMQHTAFEKQLRKHISPATYRNIVGILESVKRRGVGDPPIDAGSSCSNKSNM